MCDHSLGALHDLDWHPEVDQARLQQRQREFVLCVDPTVVAAGMVVALMKFQERPAGRAKFWPEIGLAEEPKRFGARLVLTLPVFRPVAFTHGLVEVPRPNAVACTVQRFLANALGGAMT